MNTFNVIAVSLYDESGKNTHADTFWHVPVSISATCEKELVDGKSVEATFTYINMNGRESKVTKKFIVATGDGGTRLCLCDTHNKFFTDVLCK